jgi:hypothetical protein
LPESCPEEREELIGAALELESLLPFLLLMEEVLVLEGGSFLEGEGEAPEAEPEPEPEAYIQSSGSRK